MKTSLNVTFETNSLNPQEVLCAYTEWHLK